MTLEEVRSAWERKLTPLTVMDRIKSEGCVLVILKSENDKYHCHRYFQIINDWVCSVDGESVELESVFSWLNNPTATSTKKLIKPQPVAF